MILISRKMLYATLAFAFSLSCNAKELVFNSVKFNEISGKEGLYEPEVTDHNIKRISVEVSPGSTVQGRLNMQLKVLVPPIVLKEVEVIPSEVSPQDDVIISALTKKEKGMYGVILARYVNKNGNLQVIEVNAIYSYGKGNSLKEYMQAKPELIRELFQVQI